MKQVYIYSTSVTNSVRDIEDTVSTRTELFSPLDVWTNL